MPYYRNKSSRRGPSRYARRGVRKGPGKAKRVGRGRKYRKMAITRSPWKNPIPQKGYYKFKFQDSNYELTTSFASAYQALKQFVGNSLYDPDAAAGGVQPYGYDNLCGGNCAFGAYKVFGSKIRIIPHVTASTNATFYGMRLALYPSRNAAQTYVEYEDLCQMPWCRKQVIESLNDTPRPMQQYVKTNQILSDAGDLSGETYAAYYNTSPSDSWYWNVFLDTIINANPGTIKFDVVITYYAMLYKTDDVNES